MGWINFTLVEKVNINNTINTVNRKRKIWIHLESELLCLNFELPPILNAGPDFEWHTKRSYTGDLKSRNIWNLDFLKVGFQMILFSNGRALAMAIAIVPTIKNQTIQNPDNFGLISNGFSQNCAHLSGDQMVGLPHFRYHSKSGPIATQPVLDHSKSRLVRVLDPHCIWQPDRF